VYAFLWPFLEDSKPLFARGILRAGIFERASYDVRAVPEKGMSAQEAMALRFVLVTPQNVRQIVP
jgi:hypothetical protein